MIEELKKINQLFLEIRNIENKRMTECAKKNEVFDASVNNLCVLGERVIFDLYQKINKKV